MTATRMREIIGALARSTPPTTILLTSHNLSEVEELCDRVAVISRGRIRAVDTAEHLRAAHRQRERVRLTLDNIELEQASAALRDVRAGAELSFEGALIVAQFEREVGDDTLDAALRRLASAGARIVSCESERGSLYDVLAKYEDEEAIGAKADSGEATGR
jgi:ABC-2 type transport system ATP-binding protein